MRRVSPQGARPRRADGVGRAVSAPGHGMLGVSRPGQVRRPRSFRSRRSGKRYLGGTGREGDARRHSGLSGGLQVFLALATLALPRPSPAQDPGQAFPHGPLPEGVDCSDCHTTRGWTPLDPQRTFDHAEVTGFRLTGRHAAISCASCHQDLRFSVRRESATACVSCHLDIHRGTLSADCTRCHTTEGFERVSGIRIHQNTLMPLQGAHLMVTCESCHGDDRGGAYAPLPTDCLACHREEFETPRTLDHVQSGFSTDCLECHTPVSFSDVRSFNHEAFSGGFRLLGSHERLRCQACHGPGGGLLFPTPGNPEDCVSCHLADYQREHGSGLPTTCLDCHNPNRWDEVDFDHDAAFFPIFSGTHQGRWSECTDCHTTPGNYGVFSCLDCHEHSRTLMDEKHGEEPDYVYESVACLSCHPRGRGEG